jgi:tetratricopeptide (TPR) repeat protein
MDSCARPLPRLWCFLPARRYQNMKNDNRQENPGANAGGRRYSGTRWGDLRAAGAAWANPGEWLEKALRAAGRDAAEAKAIMAQLKDVFQADLAVKLAAYDEAKRLYAPMIRGGRKDLEMDWVRLCEQKALVHLTTEDAVGADQEYDQVVAILERWVEKQDRLDLSNDLASAYLAKSITVRDLGDRKNAVAYCDRAIAIWERQLEQGDAQSAEDLARVYWDKAELVSDLGDEATALALYERVIAIWEPLVCRHGRRELANDLAMAYGEKAEGMGRLGDNGRAAELCERAIAIQESLVVREGRGDLAAGLANSYRKKAIALHLLGQHPASAALYDKAIATLERVVGQENRHELRGKLA